MSCKTFLREGLDFSNGPVSEAALLSSFRSGGFKPVAVEEAARGLRLSSASRSGLRGRCGSLEMADSS
jgi:hypothetical protein